MLTSVELEYASVYTVHIISWERQTEKHLEKHLFCQNHATTGTIGMV